MKGTCECGAVAKQFYELLDRHNKPIATDLCANCAWEIRGAAGGTINPPLDEDYRLLTMSDEYMVGRIIDNITNKENN